MLSRRPAAENPPLSTTRTNAVRLVSRSIATSDYPLSLDNPSIFSRIITCRATLHVPGASRRRSGSRSPIRRPVMADVSYVTDSNTKSGFLPSRQTIKRVGLALTAVLAVAAAVDFGCGYLTTGRYLESTD